MSLAFQKSYLQARINFFSHPRKTFKHNWRGGARNYWITDSTRHQLSGVNPESDPRAKLIPTVTEDGLDQAVNPKFRWKLSRNRFELNTVFIF